MKYSKLESEFAGDEDLEHTPAVRRYQCLNFLTSPWFIAAVAFSVGILAAFGGLKLFENIGKRDTDWLSEFSAV